MFNARINQAVDHGCNCNYGDILYSEVENMLQREASSVVAIYCFGLHKSAFISNYITARLLISPTSDVLSSLIYVFLTSAARLHDRSLNMLVHCSRHIQKLNGCTSTFSVSSI